MYHNDLPSIDGNLFSYTPLLRIVAIGFSKIRHIGEDVFADLEILHSLYLDGNVCIDEYAENRADVVERSYNKQEKTFQRWL